MAEGSAPYHPEGLTTAEAKERQKKFGFNEVEAKTTPEWQKILERYLDWVSLAILISAIISAAIPNDGDRGWTSFVLLLLELQFVVWVGYYSDRNAGNAVKELASLSAPTTVVKRDGKWQTLPIKELVPGDVVALKGGDVIPADSKLVGEGEPLKIDESSLTGESLAVTRHPGQNILAGAVVVSGELDAEVTHTGINSFFGKTMALLAVPQERGHLYKVLNRVSIALAFLALGGCIAILVVLLAGKKSGAGYSIVITFVIFTAVVPIGMPVVTTTVLAVGAREMAGEKAIVTRLSALEELSGMEVLASDKTGTLTLNKLSLDKEDILAWGNATQDDVLLCSSLSAKWENNDAIDKAVTNAMGGNPKVISDYVIKRFIPFNPVDKKTQAYVDKKSTGESFVACKGAPQIIAGTLSDPTARQACTDYIAERASRGLRSLGVARSDDDGNSWTLVGLISLLDPPRWDTARTIAKAHGLGVDVKMVTGDQHAIAVETCKRLGMGYNIMEGKDLMAGALSSDDGTIDPALIQHVDECDGFAGVYPEHKHRIVSALQAKGRLIGMTGDGVNDAPALKKANVGIAVAGATGAAKGAADIILNREGISTIITAIIRSRKIFRRLETYIIYRMASSMLILGFFFFSIIIENFEMPTWVIVVISILNDMSVMATSYDKVHSADHPLHWNMTKDLSIAFAIAAVGTIASSLLVPFTRPPKWFNWPGLDAPDDPAGNSTTSGQESALLYMALTGLIQLNILNTRNPFFWWWFSEKSAPRPSVILLMPVACFLLCSTFIAVYWDPTIEPDGGRGNFAGAGWPSVLLVWAWVVVFWIIADIAKVIISTIFDLQEATKEKNKDFQDRPLPLWVRMLDWPGDFGDWVSEGVEFAWDATFTTLERCGPKKQKKGKDDTEGPVEVEVHEEEEEE